MKHKETAVSNFKIYGETFWRKSKDDDDDDFIKKIEIYNCGTSTLKSP